MPPKPETPEAKPINEPGDIDLDELDTPIDERSVYITYNVGEVIPGAITPLGWSLTAKAIERGMLDLWRSSGVPAAALEGGGLVACRAGHVFLNLRLLALLSANVLGMSKKAGDFALAGKPLPDVDIGPPVRTSVRLLNAIRYARHIAGARRPLVGRAPRGGRARALGAGGGAPARAKQIDLCKGDSSNQARLRRARRAAR
jgi:hypothetical protein